MKCILLLAETLLNYLKKDHNKRNFATKGKLMPKTLQI